MVGISGQPSVLGFRRQKVGKAPDQAESTADTCGWRLLGTPCSSWSGRVQINQSAHPLNVQKLKVLRDSAISSDVLDSHTLDTKLNKHDYATLVELMTPLPKEKQSASCDTFSQIFSALSRIGRGCQQTEIRKGNP